MQLVVWTMTQLNFFELLLSTGQKMWCLATLSRIVHKW